MDLKLVKSYLSKSVLVPCSDGIAMRTGFRRKARVLHERQDVGGLFEKIVARDELGWNGGHGDVRNLIAAAC